MEEPQTIEEEKAQKYLDVAAAIFIVIDANRKVSLINKKGCEILGGTEDMIFGRDWFDNFMLKEEKGRVLAVFKKLISGKGKNVEYYENSIINFKGEIKLIAWHNAPLRNEKGDIIAVLSSGADITERSKIEANLAESEGRLRTILESAHDGILMVDDENKKYAYSNPMLRHMLGYTAGEIRELNIMDIHPREDLPYILEQFERLKKREIRVAKDIPVKKKDGSVFYVDINGFEVIFSGKTYMVGFFRDISERKKAEEAVWESEKRYRMLFDAAPIVIAITNPEGNALAVNNAITELAGYTPEEFMVMDMNDVYVDPDDRKRILALFQKEGRVRNFETRYKVKDNSIISVLLNTDAIEFGDKKMILATVRDITEHKKAEAALERQKESLEQKNIALSEILVQIEIEKNKIKKQIAANVDELILPIVRKLLKKGVSRKNIQLLERNLKALTDSFGLKITGNRVKLTPKEIEICDMIKNGFSGKDIAGMLNISLLTVNKHRRNIREKLGISNKNINLTSFLRTL
jgi:PAS domain S-box-containing protein